MICSRCGNNTAKQYTPPRSEQKVCLCAECFNALYGDEKEFFDALFVRSEGLARKSVLACPVCGTTVEHYRASGLLGCGHCYEALKEELLPTIRRIQGSVQHRGRTPLGGDGEGNTRIVRELVAEQETLKAEMERAMRMGDYAKADGLRQKLLDIHHKLYSEGKL